MQEPMRDTGESGPRGDLVLSSALYLVSRYAVAAAEGEVCPKLAVSIQCHLELLAERPDTPALVRPAACSPRSGA